MMSSILAFSFDRLLCRADRGVVASGIGRGEGGDRALPEESKDVLEKQLNMNNEFTSSKSQTDWERLDAMTDEDIDLSDCPEITPKMFAKAVVRRGLPNPKTKAQVTLRIDSQKPHA